MHVLDGIALSARRQGDETDTFEPTLTIHVDATNREKFREIAVPEHVVVTSTIPDWPVETLASKPERTLWHARVLFEDGKPAADFESGVSTTVALWKESSDGGFRLGQVSHEGRFQAAFSAAEIADLQAGRSWLTLTVGNHRASPKKTDPKLEVARLSTDASRAGTFRAARP